MKGIKNREHIILCSFAETFISISKAPQLFKEDFVILKGIRDILKANKSDLAPYYRELIDKIDKVLKEKDTIRRSSGYILE